jgi:hypothetical protein
MVVFCHFLAAETTGSVAGGRGDRGGLEQIVDSWWARWLEVDRVSKLFFSLAFFSLVRVSLAFFSLVREG